MATLVAILCTGYANPANHGAQSPIVTITFTEHGIPHIRASNFFGLGYGYGYAVAKIDVCALAAVFLDARGERSAYAQGEDPGTINTDLTSDLANHLLINDDALAIQRAGLTPDTRLLVDGYASGYDRYLATTPKERLPSQCRNKDWVRAISPDDVLRRIASAVLLTGFFDRELVGAVPPSANPTATVKESPVVTSFLPGAGSNGYAFGGKRTRNRRGLLLGNPHWYWTGTNRFIEVHLTIPGKYDVMGASVIGMPLIAIGFNSSMAWTHTVSTAKRGTLYQLALDRNDPMRYLVDGRSIPMNRKTVTIDVRGPNRVVQRVSHDFWLTEYGPVVESERLPWSHEKAYALADADVEDNRYLQQLLEIGEAPDVPSLKTSLERTIGLVWLDTLAADSTGDALFAEISVVPNVPKEVYEHCELKIAFPQFALVNVMDGSQTACHWRDDRRAPQRYILPAAEMPSLSTRDYVENSNSSYWLVNPSQLLEGFSPILGQERVPPNIRTRQGHIEVAGTKNGRLRTPRQFDIHTLEDILFSNRDFLAELVLDDLLAECSKQPVVKGSDGALQDLSQACSVMRQWDRKDNLNSVGAHLFREFARQEKPSGEEDPATVAAFWRVPFDPASPLDTPSGLNTTTTAPMEALARAVEKLKTNSVPLDAPLKDIQFIERNGKRIPLHGGLIFNRISLTLKASVGYTEPSGTSDSYIQVVTFGDKGPIADILLVNSQSSDAESPWYADQAELYGCKRWVHAPFTLHDIAVDALAPAIKLPVPPFGPFDH